jgi:translation initiation factor 5B
MTIDVVLVNGVLRQGDTIVVCGMQGLSFSPCLLLTVVIPLCLLLFAGPIVTNIKALLTPPAMMEIRVKVIAG